MQLLENEDHNIFNPYKNEEPFDESVTDLRGLEHGKYEADDVAQPLAKVDPRMMLDRKKTPIFKNKPIISKVHMLHQDFNRPSDGDILTIEDGSSPLRASLLPQSFFSSVS